MPCQGGTMIRRGLIADVFLGLAFCVATARMSTAEVVDSSASGFTVKSFLAIQASPDAVYRQLIHVGDWWDSEHTFSHDAHNLSIEERAGGCFCEKLPNGGSVRHLEVLFVAPGKVLRLGGGLGPLQGIATSGSMTIQLSPSPSGTKLEVTYAVGGYLPAGMNTLATPVDSVLTAQFTRLKNYVERGDPGKNEAEKAK